MSINFPTDLDTLTNPVAGDRVNSATVPHATQHANANDAIEALEVKVGKNGSGVTTSHDYKLSGVTSTDKAASLAGSEALTNKTLTSPILTTPKVTTSINDANGNEVIKTPATASAVNEVEITNAATGNDPLIAPSGNDTNIGLKLKGKGTGKVKLGDAELQVPDTDGTAGQLLKTDGAGVLSFISAEGIPNASETVAGVVEEATDAEVTAGTATGATGAKLFVTPAKLVAYNPAPVFTSAIATRDLAAASGDVTYAHGLGRTPKKVKLTATYFTTGGPTIFFSFGIFDSSGNRCTALGSRNDTGSDRWSVASTTYAIAVSDTYTTPGTRGQVGVVTVDATNITITWTKAGSPTGTISFMWEAE
jgi:hypothetical protein